MNEQTDHVVLLGFKDDRRRPNVMSQLPPTVRPGWTLGELDISTRRGRQLQPAWLRGQFAVHPMSKDPGFTISLVDGGLRMSVGGRVFRDADAACAMVEGMDQSLDWSRWVDLPDDLRLPFVEAHESADQALFFVERVYPA